MASMQAVVLVEHTMTVVNLAVALVDLAISSSGLNHLISMALSMGIGGNTISSIS